jgi:drug/metabolite transporter (DMT)-like permease
MTIVDYFTLGCTTAFHREPNAHDFNRGARTFEKQCKGRSIDRMKDSPGLHLKTYVLILFIVLFAPLGNVLLSKGMKGVGSAKNWAPGDIIHILASIITSGYIWLGIACLLTFFVAYMLVLTWADYSYVQPASSFSYAVVAMLSYFLLGEAVPPLRWIGIFVICVGVFIVGHTHPRTTEKA